MNQPEVCYELVHFSGHVQGVGFRYGILQVAKEYEVCGVVQNLIDGRVRLEVEGADTDIDGLVESVEERMDGFVHQVERKRSSRLPQFTGFNLG